MVEVMVSLLAVIIPCDDPPNTCGYRYTHTLTYTVKHTGHVHDIHIDINVKEEHIEIANLQYTCVM